MAEPRDAVKILRCTGQPLPTMRSHLPLCPQCHGREPRAQGLSDLVPAHLPVIMALGSSHDLVEPQLPCL